MLFQFTHQITIARQLCDPLMPSSKARFPFALGWVSIARGCRAQLFVRGKLVRLLTVFVSSIEARQPRAAISQPQDRLN
jgi:hypothetical protein